MLNLIKNVRRIPGALFLALSFAVLLGAPALLSVSLTEETSMTPEDDSGLLMMSSAEEIDCTLGVGNDLEQTIDLRCSTDELGELEVIEVSSDSDTTTDWPLASSFNEDAYSLLAERYELSNDRWPIPVRALSADGVADAYIEAFGATNIDQTSNGEPFGEFLVGNFSELVLLIDDSSSMGRDYPEEEYSELCLTCPHDSNLAFKAVSDELISLVYEEAPESHITNDFSSDDRFASLEAIDPILIAGVPLWDARTFVIVHNDEGREAVRLVVIGTHLSAPSLHKERAEGTLSDTTSFDFSIRLQPRKGDRSESSKSPSFPKPQLPPIVQYDEVAFASIPQRSACTYEAFTAPIRLKKGYPLGRDGPTSRVYGERLERPPQRIAVFAVS